MARKKEAEQPRFDWHRLFGMMLRDFLRESPFSVNTEMDLSIRKQLLDVAIVRHGKQRFAEALPDGLDDLGMHNLITFKSFREPLLDWTFKELTGHYVNYRKQTLGPDGEELPEDRFRLYAVCCRKPENLSQRVKLEPIRPGVYDYWRGTDQFRVVVAAELPQTPNNARLHVFTAIEEQVQFGLRHFRVRSALSSSVLHQLFRGYEVEGIPMPYTVEEFLREVREDVINTSSPEERLKGLSVDERLQGLSPEQIEAYLTKLRQQGVSPPVETGKGREPAKSSAAKSRPGKRKGKS